MSDLKGKKFEVKIRLEVNEDKGNGQIDPFFENDLIYHGIGYDGVVGIESAMIDMLNQLNEWGMVKALDGGLGEQLSALGLNTKLNALNAVKQE